MKRLLYYGNLTKAIYKIYLINCATTPAMAINVVIK